MVARRPGGAGEPGAGAWISRVPPRTFARTMRPRAAAMIAMAIPFDTAAFVTRTLSSAKMSGPAGAGPGRISDDPTRLRPQVVMLVQYPPNGRATYGKVVRNALSLRIDAVGQGIVGRMIEGGRKRRPAGERSQLDVDDIVAKAPAVREAVVLAGEQAEAVRGLPTARIPCSAGSSLTARRSWAGSVPRCRSGRSPPDRIARRSRDLESGIQDRDQPGRLRVEHERSELRIVSSDLTR